MILHGEASRGSSGPASAASKVSYRSYWDKRDDLLETLIIEVLPC